MSKKLLGIVRRRTRSVGLVRGVDRSHAPSRLVSAQALAAGFPSVERHVIDSPWASKVVRGIRPRRGRCFTGGVLGPGPFEAATVLSDRRMMSHEGFADLLTATRAIPVTLGSFTGPDGMHPSLNVDRGRNWLAVSLIAPAALSSIVARRSSREAAGMIEALVEEGKLGKNLPGSKALGVGGPLRSVVGKDASTNRWLAGKAAQWDILAESGALDVGDK